MELVEQYYTGGKRMTRKKFEMLKQPMLVSAQKEYMRLVEAFPTISEDVLTWRYKGQDLADYERMRQEFIEDIENEQDLEKKEALINMLTEELSNATKWFAFHELHEDACRSKFIKEVAFNMLRDGATIKTIQKYVPYMDENELQEMSLELQSGCQLEEVQPHG